MPAARKTTPMSARNQPKSKGTVMAERIRAKTNRLTDEEREQLAERARALINGGGPDKAFARRR